MEDSLIVHLHLRTMLEASPSAGSVERQGFIAHMNPVQKWIAYLILVIGYGFLIPGLTVPIVHVRTGIVDTETDITRSTIQTAVFLLQQGPQYYPAGISLMFFSVTLPFVKLVLVLWGIFGDSPKILHFVARISKYQFVDTFSTFMTFVFLNNPVVDTELKIGVYLFLTYCTLSVIGTQLLCFGVGQTSEKSFETIWVPISLLVMVSVYVTYYLRPVLAVGCIVLDGLRINSEADTINDFRRKLPIVSSFFCTTVMVIIPLITYCLLPFILWAGGSYVNKKFMWALIDVGHDWCMADVFLIGVLVSWMSFNATDDVFCAINPTGTYWMALYGTLTGFMNWILQYNAKVKNRQRDARQNQIMLLSNEEGGGLTLSEISSPSTTASTINNNNNANNTSRSLQPTGKMVDNGMTQDDYTNYDFVREKIINKRYWTVGAIGAAIPGVLLMILSSSEKGTVKDIAWLNDKVKEAGITKLVNDQLASKKVVSGIGCCNCTAAMSPALANGSEPCKEVHDDGGPLYQSSKQSGDDWYYAEVTFLNGIENTRLDVLELKPGTNKTYALRGLEMPLAPPPANETRIVELEAKGHWAFDPEKMDKTLPVNIYAEVGPPNLHVEVQNGTDLCCDPRNFTISLSAECHRHGPEFVTNIQAHTIDFEPPLHLTVDIFHIISRNISIAQYIDQALRDTINPLLTNQTFEAKKHNYTVASLIDQVVSANLDGPSDYLHCPEPVPAPSPAQHDYTTVLLDDDADDDGYDASVKVLSLDTKNDVLIE